MNDERVYRRLAARLDSLPNGFPPTEDGAELRLLEKLFSPEEAALAAELRPTLETPAQIAVRLQQAGQGEIDPRTLQSALKGMARKGLIAVGRTEGGLGYGLMPFVVGIYEAQVGRLDAELAERFERYYRQAFNRMLAVEPAFHRVIPVGESIPMDLEIHPYESAAEIVRQAQSWGVMDCVCRSQKALIGEACGHPIDVCMTLGKKPGLFDHSPVIRPLTLEGALETLDRAARAGLVHSVSNVQGELNYICNCCTCSCGILRGVVELGMVNVAARSAFVNTVDGERCIGCGQCLDVCQFGALSLADFIAQVNRLRCAGCGVCALSCEQGALRLDRRPAEEIRPIPEGEAEWRAQRAQARGIDLSAVS